jgi:hypothetical protein
MRPSRPTRRTRSLRESAIRTSPPGPTATPLGEASRPFVARPPSPLKSWSVPATVEIVPFGETRRIRWFPVSAMTNPPSGIVATPDGPSSDAAAAGPPSPSPSSWSPRWTPLPAAVVIVPSGATRRTRLFHVSAIKKPPSAVGRHVDGIEQSRRCRRAPVAGKRAGGKGPRIPCAEWTGAGDGGDRPVRPDATDAMVLRLGEEDAAVGHHRHAARRHASGRGGATVAAEAIAARARRPRQAPIETNAPHVACGDQQRTVGRHGHVTAPNRSLRCDRAVAQVPALALQIEPRRHREDPRLHCRCHRPPACCPVARSAARNQRTTRRIDKVASASRSRRAYVHSSTASTRTRHFGRT